MQKAKDYIMLCILSYCNFTEEDYGKNLKQIFFELNQTKFKIEGFYFSTLERKMLFYNFFKDILSNWEVFYVENKRASDTKKNSTGFYSVTFKNIKYDTYVIAYRGSEKYPLEDAYKDFIENDLKIGLGIKPLQFYDGLDVFNIIYNRFKISKEKISITGHSLGGGIAQFVSVMVDKEYGFIPYTSTWNAVGIKKDGIINILDFFNYEKMIGELRISGKEMKLFKGFKEDYLYFCLKELKKERIIKNNSVLLIKNENTISSNINENFIKKFIKETNFKQLLNQLPLSTKNYLLENNRVYTTLFQFERLTKELFEANYFIKRIKNNTAYEDNIVNFCHSKDLTVSLFSHIGSVYQVDKDFLKKDIKRQKIFSTLHIFSKSVQEYHYLDVFIPFLVMEGEKKGVFSKKLSIQYIASSIRKILTMEYCLDNQLLVAYYSLINIENNNYKKIKNYILAGIKRCGEDILYKTQLYTQIKDMDMLSFIRVWENLKTKLPTPYKLQDIYDLMLFK